MTDAVTAAPDDHRPALGGFGVLARWVWVSPVAIFAGLGLKASVQESMSYGLLGAMVVLFALVGVAFIIDGRTVMSQTRDNLWLIGVGPVPRDKSSVWSRGRLVGATVVVVGGVAAAVLAWVTAQLMASLFPRAEDLIDDRYDIYAGHSTPYVWLVQLVENGLSEELVFRSPVLAAYLLLRASTLAHRRFAWMLWAVGSVGWTTVFALSHSDYGMWNVAPAFVMGLVFVGVTVLTRTVWTAVIAHTTYNTWAVLGSPI